MLDWGVREDKIETEIDVRDRERKEVCTHKERKGREWKKLLL